MSNLEATNLILTSLKFISEKNNQLKVEHLYVIW